jgi:hypothetical protein
MNPNKTLFLARIFSDEDKDVFFNVEVNGSEEFNGYKWMAFETIKHFGV